VTEENQDRGATRAVIRPYRSEDREAIRDLFRASGQRGGPLKDYIEDEELALALLIDYHLDYEPEHCFVAEAQGVIVGYAVCSADTRRYYRVVLTKLIPWMIGRVLWRLLTMQYRSTSTFHVAWWLLTRSWREIPEASLEKYPGHMHLTLAPTHRGVRLGRDLVRAAAACGRSLGLPGGHGVVIEEAGRNAFARALGARLLESRPCTLWKHCSDREWEFKLLVLDF